MKAWFATFVLIIEIFVPACGKLAKEPTYWTAYDEHGDKPGTGLALVELDGKITAGRFYILDPNKPGDFTAGLSVELTGLQNTATGISFNIALPDGSKRNWELLFTPGAFNSKMVEVTLKDGGDSQNRAVTYVLSPAKTAPSPGLSKEELLRQGK